MTQQLKNYKQSTSKSQYSLLAMQNIKKIIPLILATEEYHFALDTIRNFLYFTLIGLSALGLHELIKLMEFHGASVVISYGLKITEHLVLIADIIWFNTRLAVRTFVVLKQTFKK